MWQNQLAVPDDAYSTRVVYPVHINIIEIL